MSECKENSCTPASASASECKTPAAASCCPVEMAAQKWSSSFCRAMEEVQVELLKARIKKAWGAELEKVGDAVIESMGVQWHAALSQARAHAGLRDSIKGVFFNASK